MTTTATASHTVQFWVDSAHRAATIEQGLENLRNAWRAAHSIANDASMGEETHLRANVTKSAITAAAEQIKYEASEAAEHAEIQRRERAEDERVAAYKAQRDARAEAAATRYGASREDLRQRRSASNAWSAVRAASAKLPSLPHAHYAVEEAGELHFFRVDKPQEGRWVGRTFVKIQASDEYYAIKSPARLVAILEAIAANPQAAMERYGRELGRCGHCHRTLTNPESIARGIGPICAERMGW